MCDPYAHKNEQRRTSVVTADAIKEEDEEEEDVVSNTSLLKEKKSGHLLAALTKFQLKQKREEQAKEEDYEETDLELEEEKEEFDVTGRQTYLNVCRQLGIVPVAYFLRHMTDSSLSLAHHGLAAPDMKALSYPLMNNTFIQTLDLEDNWLDGEGGEYIALMLKENCYITSLNISNNKLGSRGCAAVCKVLHNNVTLQNLDISGNDIGDQGIPHIVEVLLENSRLKDVNFSHNNLGHGPCKDLADSISENETIEKLDLSWNNFRLKSAVNLCEGIATNSRLRKVNLSFNGLGNEGAFGVADILKQSGTVTHIDVSNNRIGHTGAVVIGKALEANHDLLKELKIGYNPIGIEGIKAIFKGVCQEGSNVTLIDFSGIEVDKEFRSMKEELQAHRDITVLHGPVLSDYVIVGKQKLLGTYVEKINPDNIMDIIKNFAEAKGLPLLEVIEGTSDRAVSMADFLKMLNDKGITLSAAQTEHLDSLLCNYKLTGGFIDFSSYR